MSTKRVFDIVFAAMGLVVVAPVVLLIAVAVRADLGSPVLFAQRRPGLGGRAFTMYKFRTMREETNVDGSQAPDGKRLTRFGRFLRSTSLDELPELWNVLIGDMSLVGPRPLLMEYLPLYTPQQARRHEVRPGLTGWAQINGRNATSWDARFAYDVWYVDNRSFLLDLRILVMTVYKVLTREGVSARGEATMTRFLGSRSDGAGHG